MFKLDELRNKILVGDSCEVLRQFPDAIVDTVVTSPPYWQLRNYHSDGQIGSEELCNDYIESLAGVFDEIYRVLKDTGAVFVNIADTYITSSRKCYIEDFTEYEGGLPPTRQLQAKSLAAIPERFVIMMLERGWIYRNAVIWHKPDAMPSPATDRFTQDHEYIYFFVKSKKYYFKPIREPHKESSLKRVKRPWHGNLTEGHSASGLKSGDMSRMCHPDGRNKRTVWTITTKGFSGAHFAVFPPEIPHNCIQATCPENGIVLDPFLGSGTTAIEAVKMRRDFIGIELNPEYAEIARKRLEGIQLEII